MPRSYSFDHFTVGNQSVDQTLPHEEKQRYLESELEQGEGRSSGSVHYGNRFAETQERVHERLEAIKTGERPHPAEAKTGPRVRSKPAPSASESFGELWRDARRFAETVARSTYDGTEAALRLARLPWNAARLMMQELGRLRQRPNG